MVNAGLGALALLLVFGVSMALTAGSVRGGVPAQIRDMLVAGLVQLPGIMVPEWAQDVSPFAHIPKAPAADVGRSRRTHRRDAASGLAAAYEESDLETAKATIRRHAARSRELGRRAVEAADGTL